jgi:hypothetical protein
MAGPPTSHARLLSGRVQQVGRSDEWPRRLLRELDRIPPTNRLNLNQMALVGARGLLDQGGGET